MIVEDHARLRGTFSASLEDQGFRVTSVASGEEAIAALSYAAGWGERFDLVLLDYHLQGPMSGAQTLRLLRMLGFNVRAVLVSADVNITVPGIARGQGFAACVPKPTPLDVLFATIDQVLGR